MRISVKILFVILFFSFAGLSYLYLELRPQAGAEQKVVFVVSPGPFVKVVRDLSNEGLIRNKRLFAMIAKLKKAEFKLKVGEYELSNKMWPQEILEILVQGRGIQRSLTVPEGTNIFELSKIFEEKNIVTQKEFLEYVQKPEVVQELLNIQASSLEGYLYPETYFYSRGASFKTIVQKMVEDFLKMAFEVAPDLRSNRMLLHKTVILASIIEKETGAPEEREIISSVFHNRIKKKMRLQSDPTIIYGMAIRLGRIPGNIKKSDIQEKTPYNTYQIKGLPIGPISSPGREAFVATLRPAETDFLYFVSMNEGRHYFSKTYEEHNQAVQKYQMDRKARQGKSWRKMKKD